LYPNLDVGSRGMKEKAKLTVAEIERLQQPIARRA